MTSFGRVWIGILVALAYSSCLEGHPVVPIGETGYVDVEPGKVVSVGATREVTARLRQLQRAKDEFGFRALLGSALVFRLERGDRVLVLAVGSPCEVRVQSGEHMGKSGFLESIYISPDDPDR